jgi:hypothetical protein
MTVEVVDRIFEGFAGLLIMWFFLRAFFGE